MIDNLKINKLPGNKDFSVVKYYKTWTIRTL
ncbi:hypothetical protein IX307_000334 [Bacteroides pyogenes]|nr:hypothetical protein [Bacteroides pyogenes]MBR8786033.1 hypothetical protein [Bacteroides pyogenes]MBR8791515.1 hypothetical protein [Bacteroides pyogenes]MBR8794451.1 hypothetical protein [Bacteroides pyogenes]